MEDGTRSGDSNGVVVKKRNSSGCLVIRKKGGVIGGVGSLGPRQFFDSKKEKKRPRLMGSDSGSSYEQLDPYRKRAVSRISNGYDMGIVEKSDEGGRKSNNSLGYIDFRNDVDESERKTSMLGVFEFDEYDAKKLKKGFMDDSDDEVGGKSFLGSKGVAGGVIRREFETGSSKGDIVYKRKHSYFDRESDHMNNGFEMKRDGSRAPVSLLREKFGDTYEKPIRVQGRNGVLKVMPNKKKKGSGLLKTYDNLEAGLRSKDAVKSNELVRPSFYSEQKVHNKANLSVGTDKNNLNLQKSLATKNRKSIDWESDNSDTSLKLGENKLNLHKSSVTKSKALDWESDNSDTSLKLGKNRLNLQKSSATKNRKALNSESDNSDTSLKLGPKKLEGHKPVKLVRRTGDRTPPSEKIPPSGSSEGKIKHGSGTEKQKLREQIRKMLLDAGWTIDYRPRRNRDYQDAVYVNPSGTAYWSIIKAYDALQKQFDEEDDSLKPSGECSSFSPISENVLNKLTRQTQKKIEKEMKRKLRDANGAKNPQEPAVKKSAKYKHDTVSKGSDRAEEKLSSFLKQGGKSWKGKTNENAFNDSNNESQNVANNTSEDNLNGNLSIHGRKSRKLGRCTLVVRSTQKGQNNETDGYIPFTGKRTLLSWLIDSGTVGLSEKVQYMKRRQSRVMQEGWIRRDGIHCGCCSKILTVTKFEIHAGSKLCQPFQNTYLESGISLLQCQMDAWNKQEESERSSFHSVYIDGDDPNDDTCGICGDGGDLICCDGCPSTFHQSCLGIQILPTGDWHCPNCTCRLCGMAGSSIAQGSEITGCALPICSLCERKYHLSCVQDVDAFPVDSTCPPFCGKKCREMFENLQKFLGVKHELEGGFSWSLIHRTDITDSDTSVRGLTHRVECNSKLAVALTVMHECFLPIVDRRSRIHLIHNVLYNCGSNFNRLNYSGFYTAILERGDEIISAASIRFHGTQLAEMPFIGTRHIYRRQGMCSRLFRAIESALCSFKVEKLIIPALSELMHTWTEVFGFNYLDQSQKEELRSMNMLVFPGIDMLQKLLTEDGNNHLNVTTSTGTKSMEPESKPSFMSGMLNKSDEDSLVGHDIHACGAGVPHVVGTDDNVAASQGSGVTVNDVSVPSTSLDVSREVKVYLSSDEITCPNSQSGEKVPESATESKSTFPADASNVVLERGDKSILDSLADGDIKSSEDMDVSNGRNNAASVEPVSHSFKKLSSQKTIGETCENKDNVPVSNGRNNAASVVPVSHSFEKLSSHKVIGETDENKDDVSVSSLHAINENIMQFDSDLDRHNPCEKECKSYDASKDASDVTLCNETVIDSSGECSGTGMCEMRIGSQLGHNLFQSASDSDTNVFEVKTRTNFGDDLAENASGPKCVSPCKKNQDASKMENTHSFATLGGDIQSSLEADIDGASVNDSVACFEPVLQLSGDISADNSTEEVNDDTKATSFSTFHGITESLIEF